MQPRGNSPIRITIIGEYGSGRGSLIERYVDNQFSEFSIHHSTLKFAAKSLQINNQKIEMHLYKTTPEEFSDNVPRNVIHPHAIIICLDPLDSFYQQKLNKMLQICDRYMPNIERYIFLTKIDLVNEDQLKDFRFRLDALKKDEFIAGYFETSAKQENGGINIAFEEIFKKINSRFSILKIDNLNINDVDSNLNQISVESLIEKIKIADDASQIVAEIEPSLIDSYSLKDINELMGALQQAKFRKPSLFSSLFQSSPYKNVSDIIFNRFDKLVQTDEAYPLANIPSYSRLHHAANYGATFLMQELLNKKENVNSKAEYNRTPLHLAVFNGQLSAVKLLLDKGANPNMETEQKQNALLIALERAFIFLPGATQNSQDKKNLTIFSEMIEILMSSNKIDINTKTSGGTTIFAMLEKYHQSLKETELQLFRENILRHFETLLANDQKQVLSIKISNYTP